MKKGGWDEQMIIHQQYLNPAPLALELDALPIELSRTLLKIAIYGYLKLFLPLSLPYLSVYLVVKEP